MTYREAQIKNAETKISEARKALETATGKITRRDLMEEIEFWSNKLAFLTNLKYGLFADEK